MSDTNTVQYRIISQKDKEKRWQGFLTVSMMLSIIQMYVVGEKEVCI